MTKFVWQSCQTVGNETRPKTRLVIEGHEGLTIVALIGQNGMILEATPQKGR